MFLCRTSVLRSSQNSLQSSITGPQRPSSAYYPPSSVSNPPRSNLHQSIPNLKNPPVAQRLQNEDSRAGSYPSVNQQHYSPNYAANSGYNGRQNPAYIAQQNYGGYPRPHEEVNNRQYNSPYGNSYPSPTHSAQNYPHVHTNGQRQDRSHDPHYNSGLLREDVFRHSQTGRPEEMLRYPSTNNVRISEAQIQHSRPQHEDSSRQNDMRVSKSEDMLRQYNNSHGEMMRYASSGNVRAQESSKVDLTSLRHADHIPNRVSADERTQILKEEARLASNVRGQAKLAEMSEEVARRQNRMYGGLYQQQQQQVSYKVFSLKGSVYIRTSMSLLSLL